MTRPYLHAPLPRFVRRLLKAPRIWLGIIYTPWSFASREALIADLLETVELMRDLQSQLDRAKTENVFLRAQLSEIETQRQLALGEMPGASIG